MPSAVIRAVEYDPIERRLDVEFTSGRRYRYHEVPEEIVDALHRAYSRGAFFNSHIREHFRCTRLD